MINPTWSIDWHTPRGRSCQYIWGEWAVSISTTMGLQLRSLQTCSRNGGGRCKAQRYIACKAALPASYRPFLGPDPNRIDGEGFYQCGPVTPRPSYEAIDANAFNKVMLVFSGVQAPRTQSYPVTGAVNTLQNIIALCSFSLCGSSKAVFAQFVSHQLHCGVVTWILSAAVGDGFLSQCPPQGPWRDALGARRLRRCDGHLSPHN